MAVVVGASVGSFKSSSSSSSVSEGSSRSELTEAGFRALRASSVERVKVKQLSVAEEALMHSAISARQSRLEIPISDNVLRCLKPENSLGFAQ